jgi:hypothetical protein
MRRDLTLIILQFIIILLLNSCSGTIYTVQKSNEKNIKYSSAYIISAENSQYIKFKFGVVTPYGYFVLPDDPSVKTAVIGNTDTIIKKELEKYGINTRIGEKGDFPEGIDLIVLYYDTWRWDFKKILDKLDIVFISPNENKELARSTFNIYKNKEFHNFPTPEKEVPKMIKELLNK